MGFWAEGMGSEHAAFKKLPEVGCGWRGSRAGSEKGFEGQVKGFEQWEAWTDLKQGSDMVWFRFEKDHSGYWGSKGGQGQMAIEQTGRGAALRPGKDLPAGGAF